MARLAFPPQLAEKIRNSSCDFIVTGGGGWIGQAALEMLESALGDDVAKRVFVFGSNNRDLKLRTGRMLSCRELKRITALNNAPKIFIHCAFLTKEKTTDRSIENFVSANRAVSDLVAGAVEATDARGFFSPSSGAVYKKGAKILDDDLQANAYGVMKIEDEKRFLHLAAKKKNPFCMPRLFNLSGPFINKHDSYALASIIKNVLAGKPITVRAAHSVIRSYIHVADLLSLAMSMLLEPKPGDPAIFDTAGEEALEVGDLADLIRKTLGHPELAIERPARVEGKDDIYVGDGKVMRRLMCERGLTLRNMVDQIRDTADFMRTCDSRS